MMLKRLGKKLPVLFLLTSLWGCTPKFQGEYSNPMEVEIIDEYWNDSDARKTAEVLIGSMLQKPWLDRFKHRYEGKLPILIVKDIENRTDEHIDTNAILEFIRDEVLNSGMVRFVDGDGRAKIIAEIDYQQSSGMVSGSSAKNKGKQLGADFMVTGNISSQVHTQDGLKTVSYQVVLQLTNLETAEIAWSQKNVIKKRMKRSGSGW